MSPRLRPYLLPAWSGILAVIVLLPVLLPGYVLHVDMVFVPHQTLLPWNLGIGGGLPRAVPQDAVVSVLAGPIPGEVLQKTVLLAALVLAGIGAGRLSGSRLTVQLPAAAVYLWSAYTASRLLMGHWSLLWAMGLLPWVVLWARQARTQGRWLPVVLLCAASALVPTGGIIAAVTALALVMGFGSVLPWSRRILVAGLIIAVNAPWWLAAVRSASSTVSDPLGLVVFGARGEGFGGVLLSVLAGAGVWNTQATLPSRTTVLAAFAVLVLILLAAMGWTHWRRQARPEAVVLTALGLCGLGWAWVSGVAEGQSWAQYVVSDLPGGGLLRDGQKWTVWWVLLVAVCAPHAVSRVPAVMGASVRVVLAAAIAVLPLAMLPDLAGGGFGRLRTTTYPSDWDSLRQELAVSPLPGDVVSLPWTPFRRYPWNRSQVVLDPLPRYLTRTVVFNDALPVKADGELVEVGGDDPRAAAIGVAIADGRPLPAELAALGIGWIVVQQDQPHVGPSVDLTGAKRVWSAEQLELWRVEQTVTPVRPTDALLVAVNIAVGGFVVGGTGLLLARRMRSPGKVTTPPQA